LEIEGLFIQRWKALPAKSHNEESLAPGDLRTVALRNSGLGVAVVVLDSEGEAQCKS
jgi:hypothetical protein